MRHRKTLQYCLHATIQLESIPQLKLPNHGGIAARPSTMRSQESAIGSAIAATAIRAFIPTLSHPLPHSKNPRLSEEGALPGSTASPAATIPKPHLSKPPSTAPPPPTSTAFPTTRIFWEDGIHHFPSSKHAPHPMSTTKLSQKTYQITPTSGRRTFSRLSTPPSPALMPGPNASPYCSSLLRS